MTDKHSYLWVEKYRPRNLDNYIFDGPSHERAFKKFIEEKKIPHLLLTGLPGSGKSTIANILINLIGIPPEDVLRINASDENSVDVMRDKIKRFVSTYAFGDLDFKVVLLEEGDFMTHGSQAILRRLMEDFADDSRFIITANHENKIIPAIKSRCQHFQFSASDKDDIAEYVATILDAENIAFDLDDLDMYVRASYPDIRKIVQTIQQSTADGNLAEISDNISGDTDINVSLLSLLAKDKWLEARKLVCSNATNDQIEKLYRFLYLNIEKSKKFSDQANWENAQIEIAYHLYMHAIVSDPEINLSALFIKLNQI